MIRADRAPRLTDVDLQLYLAGALPLGKRLLLRWTLRLDPELRARLARLREENAAFRRKEMRRLEGILFPAPIVRGARAGAVRERGPAWLPALAGACCVLLFCALPFRAGLRDVLGGALDEAVNDPDVIAKGRGLGVSLFVKGDSAYRVESQTARVAATDTLQVMPLGAEPQYLALLGWDARQGLVRLFPREGGRAPRVSRSAPPPALLLQDVADNRLICVTATGPFSVADAEAALRGKPFQPLDKAPSSHLGKGLYLQIFSITRDAGRI
jgi:hypothetical protein